MPRRARHPGTGKPPVNTPASRIPAGGVGIGGPARPPRPFSAEHRPTPQAILDGKLAAARLRELLSPHLGRAVDAWLANLTAPEAAARNAAAAHIIERLAGKVPQPVATDGDGAIALGIIVLPPKGEA